MVQLKRTPEGHLLVMLTDDHGVQVHKDFEDKVFEVFQSMQGDPNALDIFAGGMYTAAAVGARPVETVKDDKQGDLGL